MGKIVISVKKNGEISCKTSGFSGKTCFEEAGRFIRELTDRDPYEFLHDKNEEETLIEEVNLKLDEKGGGQ